LDAFDAGLDLADALQLGRSSSAKGLALEPALEWLG
jgi:hypothetical protein